VKILHIITSLYAGGAQIMLYKLLANNDRMRLDSTVISLMDSAEMGEKIESLGVDVHSLGMKRGTVSLKKILYLTQLIRKINPDLIQTWMYHSDLLGSLAALLAAVRVPVIWGIHHSNLDPQYNDPTTLKVAKLCAHISRFMPARIISCSQAAKETHRQIGYYQEKMVVIPNGFDLCEFHPDQEAREVVRENLHINSETILIGMMARFDPQKDHKNFIQAASILLQEHQNVEFVLCGSGMDQQNAALMEWIREVDIEPKVHLLGHRKDVSRILAALDIATLSSCGEAFPLVVGEAMACGIPCVVTDVGDSALLVGDTGIIVPPQNPLALAEGWSMLIDAGAEYRKKTGNDARARISSTFDIADIAVRYGEVYKEALYGPLTDPWPCE